MCVFLHEYVCVVISTRDNCGVKHLTDPECRLRDLPNLAIYHTKASSHLCVRVCVRVCTLCKNGRYRDRYSSAVQVSISTVQRLYYTYYLAASD